MTLDSEVTMPEIVSLTLSEAGYVVGQSSTAINRAVDRGVIKAKRQRRGKHRLRKVGPAELRYLAIASQVEKDLTPAGRRKVYEAVRRLPSGAHRLDLGVMELKLADIDRRISERLTRLGQVKALVEERGGSDPVLRGTAVPVYAVAALAKNQTVAEIAEDYPGLTSAEIEAAVEYAKVYPRTGRPLPVRSLKRMLADAAASGLWDVTDAEPVAPQLIP
jgi:uncharacterized protein (DUF433 family)